MLLYYKILLVTYLVTNLIIPIIRGDRLSEYPPYTPIEWSIHQGKLRDIIFYIKLIYFLPFIIVWVLYTILKRLFILILYKD